MDTKTQAQKGFKTFMLTLVISLFLFSAVYVVLNRGADDTPNTATTTNSATGSAAGTQYGGSEGKGSVFAELASNTAGVRPRAVLAADDTADDGMASADGSDGTTGETPESTVPDTGISGPTAGIILSSAIFGVVGYILLIGPRKLALSSFEKKTLRDLDSVDH